MAANLLIIESPGKIKKLKQILGSEWIVKASLGHIRELAKDGEGALGFELGDRRVECRYVPRSDDHKKLIAELKKLAKQCDRVILATDDDREGETISWHLADELKLKNPQRAVYSEITEQAVKKAITNLRPINQSLVGAGLARACLDKLVGYRGSPLVWSMNIGAKSMGRVQTAALYLLCELENRIISFQKQDYWSVWIDYGNFKAFYYQPKKKADEGEQVSGVIDDAGSEEAALESDRITSQTEADRIVAIAHSSEHQVLEVTGKIIKQNPPPAFTTSSLQQAASSRYKFGPELTMQLAQKLYEGGHITYMRTDSVHLSDEFCEAVREYLAANDPDNVPDKVAKQKSAKGAQEAHEAIRPTHVEHPPGSLGLPADQEQLYEIIWSRAVATQCIAASIRKSQIITRSGDAYWQARGQVVEVPGYLTYWDNISGDTQLPTLKQHQSLKLKKAGADKKQTQPPSRYTEARFVQVMEQKGIGRPSTYAPTIQTLKTQGYAQVEKGKLAPTEMGRLLIHHLSELLPDLIQPGFTAEMERSLDAIATGKLNWEQYLLQWNADYFEPALSAAMSKLGIDATAKAKGSSKSPVKLSDYLCPVCNSPLEEHPYVKDGNQRAMLRCSVVANRKGNCKEVAFFKSSKSNNWWSSKFGELANSN
jgi:DNA topoisomerase-1